MPGTASATQMQAVPLPLGVHSLPAVLLELRCADSLAGSFLTDLGTEICSHSGSPSTNNCV